MHTTTKPAKKGRTVCNYCNTPTRLLTEDHVVNRVGEVPYSYLMEYSLCPNCKIEYIPSQSIYNNEQRSKQAKKEAQIAYKMKKWLGEADE